MVTAPAVAIAAALLGVLAFQIVGWASGWETGSDSGNGLAAMLIVFLTLATIGCGSWLAIVRWARDSMQWPGRWGMTFFAVVALAPTSFLLGLMSVEILERFTGAPSNSPVAVASLAPGVSVGLAAACVVGGIIRASMRTRWTVLVALPLSVWLFSMVSLFGLA